MGAYEYQQPNPATVAIECNYTSVVVGITASFKGVFSRGKSVSWDFGDGTVVSNQLPNISHSWAAPGDYVVALQAYNDSHPDGVSAMVTVHVEPGAYYVALESTNPVAPYVSWATAATTSCSRPKFIALRLPWR